MNIDHAIFLNQLAQQIKPMPDGVAWFNGLGIERKDEVLRGLGSLIIQAGAAASDVEQAISASGIKPTATPCVVLTKGAVRIQLAKIASLPEPELSSAFILLISLLGIADERRRRARPLDLVSHWWHRDLRDEVVLAKIRKDYEMGNL